MRSEQVRWVEVQRSTHLGYRVPVVAKSVDFANRETGFLVNRRSLDELGIKLK